jgi:hypothetical protein
MKKRKNDTQDYPEGKSKEPKKKKVSDRVSLTKTTKSCQSLVIVINPNPITADLLLKPFSKTPLDNFALLSSVTAYKDNGTLFL